MSDAPPPGYTAAVAQLNTRSCSQPPQAVVQPLHAHQQQQQRATPSLQPPTSKQLSLAQQRTYHSANVFIGDAIEHSTQNNAPQIKHKTSTGARSTSGSHARLEPSTSAEVDAMLQQYEAVVAAHHGIADAELASSARNCTTPQNAYLGASQPQQRRLQFTQHKQSSIGVDSSGHPSMSGIHAAQSDSSIRHTYQQLALNGGVNGHPLAPVGGDTRVVQMLHAENAELRQKIHALLNKSVKVQQLEMHYQKIQHEYEEMMRSQGKRELLVKQFEASMQQQVLHLTERNQQLQSNLSRAHLRLESAVDTASSSHSHVLKADNDQLQLLVAQLLPQNKELLARVDAQTMQIRAQADTLDEQRNHITILDTALHNAQAKVLHLEQERERQQSTAVKLTRLCEEQKTSHDAMRRREQQLKHDIIKLQRDMAIMNAQRASQVRRCLSVKDTETAESVASIKTLQEQLDAALVNIQSMHTDRSDSDIEKEQRDSKSDHVIAKHNIELKQQLSIVWQDRENIQKSLSFERKENECLRRDLNALKDDQATHTTSRAKMEACLVEREAMIDVLRQATSDSSFAPDAHQVPAVTKTIPSNLGLNAPSLLALTRARAQQRVERDNLHDNMYAQPHEKRASSILDETRHLGDARYPYSTLPYMRDYSMHSSIYRHERRSHSTDASQMHVPMRMQHQHVRSTAGDHAASIKMSSIGDTPSTTVSPSTTISSCSTNLNA